jgi:hypothetical protein
MRNCSFNDEAEACRREAVRFAGRPEAHFLMRLAGYFDELQAARLAQRDSETGGYLPADSLERDARSVVGQ